MKTRTSWSALKQDRLSDPKARDGYEAARHAFKLGQQVRELREARSLSQAKLARRMGTSQSAIARLELGGVDSKLETLQRLSRALDADLVIQLRPHRPAPA